MRLFVVFELSHDARRVRQEYDQFARKYPGRLTAPLLLLGRKSKAQDAIRLADPPLFYSQRMKDNLTALKRFSAGEISEGAYLASVAGDRSEECYAHFYIGLFRLAEADRAAAKSHFDKAFRTHCIASWQSSWSLMFHSRLEKDPKWPPWIPVKK
jgi:hypothetical protein